VGVFRYCFSTDVYRPWEPCHLSGTPSSRMTFVVSVRSGTFAAGHRTNMSRRRCLAEVLPFSVLASKISCGPPPFTALPDSPFWGSASSCVAFALHAHVESFPSLVLPAFVSSSLACSWCRLTDIVFSPRYGILSYPFS